MKIFERDDVFSLGITVPQHLHFPNSTRKHPERLVLEDLEKLIQQKAESAKPKINKLNNKLSKFNPHDFQLIKDHETDQNTHSKIWVKMYNDKRTQNPQANIRKLCLKDNKIKKGKKLEIEEIVGVSFDGLAFVNLSTLFLNANCKSIRLVAEDIGVFNFQERKSAFDQYDDEDEVEEIDPEEGEFKD